VFRRSWLLAAVFVLVVLLVIKVGQGGSRIRMDSDVLFHAVTFARAKTKLLTERINRKHGYGSVVICTAKEVLEDEQPNEI